MNNILTRNNITLFLAVLGSLGTLISFAKIDKICNFFNIERSEIMDLANDKTPPILSPTENKQLSNYRQLNPESQKKVYEYGTDLVHLGRYKKCDFCGVSEKET